MALRHRRRAAAVQGFRGFRDGRSMAFSIFNFQFSISLPPLPRDRRADRIREVVEVLFGVQLGDGDEEVVRAIGIELPERDAAEDFLVLEIEQDVGCRDRRGTDRR